MTLRGFNESERRQGAKLRVASPQSRSYGPFTGGDFKTDAVACLAF
jgi:hypothetical protein